MHILFNRLCVKNCKVLDVFLQQGKSAIWPRGLWIFYRPRTLKDNPPLFPLMRPQLWEAAMLVPCSKTGQVHISTSNQHICKKRTLNRYFPISIERLPVVHVFCSHKGYPSCVVARGGLNKFTCVSHCVSLPGFPKSQAWPFLSRLLPEPPSSSLPVLHLPSRPALFQMRRSDCRGLKCACFSLGPRNSHISWTQHICKYLHFCTIIGLVSSLIYIID